MLLHDAIQPFYTSRTRAADLQRPFQTASATFSAGRWKRATALKIPRKSWTEWEFERRMRYHHLAVVYPRLVSRDQKRLRSSARDANSRSDWNAMREAVFYLVQNRPEALVGMTREDFQYLVTFRFFSTLHLPYLLEFKSHVFNISTESDIFANIKST